MSNTKKFSLFIGVMTMLIIGAYIYHVHFNYRFTTITKDKVYKSGLIPPDKLVDYIEDYDIKTVIDLRIGHIIDPLNPSLKKSIIDEEKAVNTVDGVTYYNIPSRQIPSEENMAAFYALLDNEKSYPVLIHCHHGIGRASLYSALYRIEYEGFTNEDARKNTRPIVYLSSFDNGTPKGEWLKNYKNRDTKKSLLSSSDKGLLQEKVSSATN